MTRSQYKDYKKNIQDMTELFNSGPEGRKKVLQKLGFKFKGDE